MTLRKLLIDLEQVEHETKEKRLELMRKLKSFDDERAAEATYNKMLSLDRLNEMKAKEQQLAEMESVAHEVQRPHEEKVRQLLVEIPEDTEPTNVGYLGKINLHSTIDAKSPHSQTSSKTHRSSRSRRDPRKRGFQCGECNEIFVTLEDREDHCRDEHDIECEVCEKVFKSFRALDLHKDKEDHW